GRRDLVDERRSPGRLRVELEAHTGERASRRGTGSIEGSLPRPSELTKRTGCGSSPSTSRSERPAWRSEVERRRLKRPVAEAQRHFPLRRLGPQVEGGERVAEAAQRPLALERQRGPRLVQRTA